MNSQSDNNSKTKNDGNEEKSIPVTVKTINNKIKGFIADSIINNIEKKDKNISNKLLKRKVSVFILVLLVFIYSVIISSAEFSAGIYPIGISLLCAISSFSKEKTKNIYFKNFNTAINSSVIMAVIISSLFYSENSVLYFLIFTVIIATRVLITRGELSENVILRTAFAFFASTAIGVINFIFGNYDVNKISYLFSISILAPIFTYLFSGLYLYDYNIRTASRITQNIYYEASLYSFFYIMIYSFSSFELLGFNISIIISIVTTLYFAKNKGPLYGSFWGFIGGLGINVYVFAPILGICGFFSGLFFEKSYLLAIMTAFLSTSGYSLYIDGFKSFSVLMPNFLIALSIFLFFDKFETLKREQTVDLNLNKIKNIEISSQVTDNRLLKLSDAFYSLSQVFYTYSEKSKIPALNDCIKIVNDACESVCEGCIKKDLCWGENNFDTNDSITKLSLILLKNGELTEKEQKLFDKENCVKFSRLIKKINSDYSQISAKLISENKTQVLANEYNSFSKLLKKTADNLNKELTYEPENEKKVKDILGKLNILYDSITVFGKRNIKIDVYGIKIELLKISSNDIKNEFSNEFKCKFEDPCFLMTENRVVMRIQKQRKYLLECAKATCAKNGETVNGDSSSFFENDNNFFYSLICDGMGSGKDAALTSRLSAIIIEKLMNSISTKSVALDLLNGFLINKREECFSTVDLFEIDLLTGEGAFIKAGAAASYVIRGKNIFKISSSTTPTGILYNVRAEQTKLELYPGDIIIMTSDGLSDEIDTPLWLSKLSFNEEIENVSVLAKKILSLAKEEKEKSDDMTVSVMKIKST